METNSCASWLSATDGKSTVSGRGRGRCCTLFRSSVAWNDLEQRPVRPENVLLPVRTCGTMIWVPADSGRWALAPVQRRSILMDRRPLANRRTRHRLWLVKT